MSTTGLPALEPAQSAAEAIAARDLNNLFLTSRYFQDANKYRAFCALYAVMRVVDDRIDDIPSRQALTDIERAREHRVVDAWAEVTDLCFEGRAPTPQQIAACDHEQAPELIVAFRHSLGSFPVPPQLWKNFYRAMHTDIDSARFERYEDFLTYSEGATVAPTTIYLYLIAAGRHTEQEEVYTLPHGFDLVTCGRKLGIFAYLAHILRDLAEDLQTGDEGLLYFSREDMAAHGVTEPMLFEDLRAGTAGEPLRALARTLTSRSREALAEGRELMAALDDRLTEDCDFILQLIVAIYEAIDDKITQADYDPMAQGLGLSLVEKMKIAQDVARRTGFDPPNP